MAYRGSNRYPVVLVHIEGVSHGVDEAARFTPRDEARQLAQYLLTAASLIDPVAGQIVGFSRHSFGS